MVSNDTRARLDAYVMQNYNVEKHSANYYAALVGALIALADNDRISQFLDSQNIAISSNN